MLIYTLLCSLILSWEDWQHQSYPLWLWGIFTLPLLFWGQITSSFWLLLLLALLFALFPLGMGAGDFLYLATVSLVLTTQEILCLIQIACLAGLVGFFLSKKQGQSIPFIPYLTLGLLGVVILPLN